MTVDSHRCIDDPIAIATITQIGKEQLESDQQLVLDKKTQSILSPIARNKRAVFKAKTDKTKSKTKQQLLSI